MTITALVCHRALILQRDLRRTRVTRITSTPLHLESSGYPKVCHSMLYSLRETVKKQMSNTLRASPYATASLTSRDWIAVSANAQRSSNAPGATSPNDTAVIRMPLDKTDQRTDDVRDRLARQTTRTRTTIPGTTLDVNPRAEDDLRMTTITVTENAPKGTPHHHHRLPVAHRMEVMTGMTGRVNLTQRTSDARM